MLHVEIKFALHIIFFI